MGRHSGLKRNATNEKAAIQWIFTILGEPVPQGEFEQILKDGSVLCRFIQKIRPDLLTKYAQSEQPAKQRENIGLFTTACSKLGVGETNIFQTVDLHESKDLGAVTNCLWSLGGILQKERPDLPSFGG